MKTKSQHQVRFSTRGRVMIPAAVRRKYGIKAGQRLPIEAQADGTMFIRVKPRGEKA